MILTRAELDAAITLAGIKACRVEEVQNGYDRDDPSPWFVIFTPEGQLRVGPRKRVIELNWVLTNRRTYLGPREGPFSKSTSETILIHLDSKFELAQYLEKWLQAKPAEEFVRLVAEEGAIGDYIHEYVTEDFANDPFVKELCTRTKSLYKIVDPVTREVSFRAVTAGDIDIIIPGKHFKR